jgi:hypothetical protein
MDRFREPDREPEVVETCEECENEIRIGDSVTRFEGGEVVHSECEDDFVSRAFVDTRGIIDGLGAVE